MLNQSYKFIWRLSILGVTSSSLIIYFHKDNNKLIKRVNIKPFLSSFFRYSYMTTQSLENQKLLIEEFCTPPNRPDLPIIKIDELKKHDKNSDRIWVNFQKVNIFLIIIIRLF